MNSGKYIFSQIISLASHNEFKICVERYNGNYKIQDFSCWEQFLYLVYGQLTFRESIHDIINCLTSQRKKLYHIGIKSVVAVSTVTRANENRNWQIYADFAKHLIVTARSLYITDNEFVLDLGNTIYALDSSTIDLCLNTFWWAKFRKHKGAIKMHTLLDLRGNIPTFICITTGKIHDVNILDTIEFEIGAFYVIDRGYIDFKRLYLITNSLAFFVTRGKSNLQFRVLKSKQLTISEKEAGLRCDQTIKLTVKKSKKDYPAKLRRIKFKDLETGKTYVYLTNNFTVDALIITKLYKYRWKIELFFKWIKGHLKIKTFWGHSENAVKMQIWIAICAFLLVAIAKKRYKIEHTIYEMLQIISVSAFDKDTINELFSKPTTEISKNEHCNQLTIF